MSSTVSATALRWVLLCTLAIGLVGMHGLVLGTTTHADHAMSAAASTVQPMSLTESTEMQCCADHQPGAGHPGESPSRHGHDIRHLCLAVLVAITGLLLKWMRWPGRAGGCACRVAVSSNPGGGRSPPLAGSPSELLSRLCVLRL